MQKQYTRDRLASMRKPIFTTNEIFHSHGFLMIYMHLIPSLDPLSSYAHLQLSGWMCPKHAAKRRGANSDVLGSGDITEAESKYDISGEARVGTSLWSTMRSTPGTKQDRSDKVINCFI